TAQGDPASFVDPAEVALDAAGGSALHIDANLFAHVIRAMCGGEVSVVGIFGPRGSGHESCARAIAAGVGRPLRWLAADCAAALDDSLAAGAALGAILWLDADRLTEPGNEPLRDLVATRLASRQTPLVMSGVHPWRPAQLLAARSFVEIELPIPDIEARTAMWTAALPDA